MPQLMVTAWATNTRMVLAQTQAPKGNEVKGTLDLLKTTGRSDRGSGSGDRRKP